MYGVRWEELFRAPPDCTPQRAKVLRAEWEAEIENRIAALRANQRGEGRDLTQRQAHALAGEWYRWFIGPHEENPGKPDHWDDLYRGLIEWLEDVAGDPEMSVDKGASGIIFSSVDAQEASRILGEPRNELASALGKITNGR